MSGTSSTKRKLLFSVNRKYLEIRNRIKREKISIADRDGTVISPNEYLALFSSMTVLKWISYLLWFQHSKVEKKFHLLFSLILGIHVPQLSTGLKRPSESYKAFCVPSKILCRSVPLRSCSVRPDGSTE